MDIFAEKLDKIFSAKLSEVEKVLEEDSTEEAAFKPKKEQVPFEVNQVLHRIEEEIQRRKKVLKRKDS